MDSENGTGSNAPPGRYVTVNQVVAWNLAWYRRQAGLSQKELGQLTGRTNGAISDMERSWKDQRHREFNAQFLASAAELIGIPLTAFFLPPLDDAENGPYWFTAADGECGEPLSMRDLMVLAMPDNDERTGVMDAYRDRLITQTDHYLDEEWAADVTRWQRMHEDRGTLARRAARLRGNQQVLERAAADQGKQAAAIEAALEEEDREAGR